LVPGPASITNNVAIFSQHPEFIEAIAAVCEALRPYPHARTAVSAALRSLGLAGGPSLIELKPAEAA
jgi:hypothetical protein